MRAVQIREFGNWEQLFVGEVPVPARKKGEVLVRVHASALNRADLLQREGKYPPPEGASDILGLEMAGEVVEADLVSKWPVGSRVMALLGGGGQAEFVAVAEELLMPIPDNLTYNLAAAIPEVFLTAYQAMFVEGKAPEMGAILIHAGASGVGTAAIQLARLNKMQTIVTCSPSKHKVCLNLGADFTIDYKTEPVAKKVLDYTAGNGVDMVLDFIGGPNFNENLEVLNHGGQLIQIALMGGVKAQQVNIAPILRKNLKIVGTTLRSRPLEYKSALIKAFMEEHLGHLTYGSLRPIIDSVYPLRDIQEAHKKMEANLNAGKIVLEI
jgi:putative PIG3 family NAD(P)H quinone oxidoreductase